MDSIYFPVFLDLLGARVVVVGGGAEAEERVEALLRAGARITVVAPQATARLRRYGEEARLRWVAREYRTEDFDEAALVLAADPDPALQHRACEDARAAGVWVHRGDEPLDSCVRLPQVFERGPVQVAVYAEPAAPAFRSALLQAVANAIGIEFGVLGEWLAERRSEVELRIPSEDFGRELAEVVMKSEVPQLLREGHHTQARQRFEELRAQCEAAWALPR
ncbi:MAG TPA: NAD(P)-dependent oxidoreductase [Candidatus Saccharimonadales bacterium]|nr:NAD(P)-dependent oxidoreductase [Candidatus Saccharimonadales bacterium]